MRIYITADAVGGVREFAMTLADGIAREGHRVRLAFVGGAPPDLRLPPGVETCAVDAPLEWMPGATESDIRGTAEFLARDARAWAADVVHLNQLAYAASTFHAPTIVTIHSDVHSWFVETRGHPAPREWAEYGRWIGAGIHSADVLVSPSEYQSRLTLTHHGRAADRIIFNGVAAGPANTPGVPGDAGSFRVITGARAWDPAKGVDLIHDAARRLPPERFVFDVFGDTVGPHGQRFDSDTIRLHGRVARTEFERRLLAADLYLAPSRYEPFGLAPLEAAHAGLPLLLSDIGSFRELWSGAAAFFPVDDPRSLARRLGDLAEDRAGRDGLAARSRHRARERYGFDRFIREHLELYTGALSCV